MAPKKQFKTTVASTSRAQAALNNSLLHYMINKFHISFTDAEHATRCDVIMTTKICAPSYLDMQMVPTVHIVVGNI